jgi:hypothetical protein
MNPYDQSKKVAIFDLILNNSKPSNNHTPHFDISKLNGYSIVKLSYKNPPDMGYPYILILKLDHGNDYDNRNNGYNQINLLLNNSSFTLVLFECLMIGWFIPKSIAIMFESIKLLIDSPEGLLPSISSQESGNGCKIVRMPNIILPNMAQLLITLPEWIHNDTKEWSEIQKKLLLELGFSNINKIKNIGGGDGDGDSDSGNINDYLHFGSDLY